MVRVLTVFQENQVVFLLVLKPASANGLSMERVESCNWVNFVLSWPSLLEYEVCGLWCWDCCSHCTSVWPWKLREVVSRYMASYCGEMEGHSSLKCVLYVSTAWTQLLMSCMLKG